MVFQVLFGQTAYLCLKIRQICLNFRMILLLYLQDNLNNYIRSYRSLGGRCLSYIYQLPHELLGLNHVEENS